MSKQQVKQEKNYIDSADAEQIVLSVMINNSNSISDVADFLKVEMFIKGRVVIW